MVNGDLVNVNFTTFRGHWTLFCVLPCLSRLALCLLDQQASRFTRQEALLAGFIPHEFPFRDIGMEDITALSFPLLTDPVGRLSRAFGLVSPRDPEKGQSLLFDPEGRGRYHLIHDLNGRGMAFVSEMLAECRHQIMHRTRESRSFFSPEHIPLSLCTEAE